MKTGKSAAMYEVITRNLNVKYHLDLMFDKYGIKDFSLILNHSWNLRPIEIYPLKNNQADNRSNVNVLESLDDLVLYQYHRLEHEILTNPLSVNEVQGESGEVKDLIRKSSVFDHLRDGFSYLYLVQEETPVKSFQIFNGFLGDGVKGLCITQMHPDQLSISYGLKTDEIKWLCHNDGENNIDPTDLSKLIDTINDFVHKNGNSVILLDGLEFLITHNGLKKVLNSLNTIRNNVDKDTMFILPIHPKASGIDELVKLEEGIIDLPEK